MKLTCSVAPKDVFKTIESVMLRDGFDIVIDMEKSKGSHIIDADTGKNWLDFYTFFASAPFGMNHPKLDTPEFKEKVFRSAINKVANSDIYTEDMAEFVKTFHEIAMPEGFEHLFLIDYGTLAVENCFKIAMDWKVQKLIKKGKITLGGAFSGRKGTKIIHFNEAFHGRSGYTLSVTNTHDPNKHQRYAKFTDWPRVINPKIFFPPEEHLEETEWLEAQSIKQIKNAIANDPDGHCAIIIETIQGEGGDNHFRTEFFQQLRNICDESEIMLIFDEVQCGMGITGKMWAWQHHFPVKPDLFAFAKKAQVCGVVAGPRVDENEQNCFNVSSRINSTWGGNLVDMVRAQRYLEIYRDDNILDYVSNTAGPALMKGLQKLQAEFPEFISNVRGKGLMCAYDIKTGELRDKFLAECRNEGMLILGCGAKTVRFRPALNVPVSDIEHGIEISRSAAKKVFLS
ncbi:L-lysine 6-transaminase [Synergistes jonesii]|uniref:L-lysine-epsilon aminotransferase n=1 Tax=Synergistes jonesii TaxID=2754 RepID=A0A073IRF6_9BACT|nr:L-lysine 6-transaminase [Synergistes jonesii]KEJ92031.1 L-lysine 6-aminotransferase [Synergistes jonesii]OFB61974.1 L-lysine 6-aminotransferase [Synergistes jonesii]OFB62579.1 L-lysine 6-aminotransferase [Synergistes jonesii]OFB64268.1 L-lysine 6-aminotransferase [Synergistes jonesii]OFB67415.1 L-lysine 6-aminotransferase [Synergistes jonesii]